MAMTILAHLEGNNGLRRQPVGIENLVWFYYGKEKNNRSPASRLLLLEPLLTLPHSNCGETKPSAHSSGNTGSTARAAPISGSFCKQRSVLIRVQRHLQRNCSCGWLLASCFFMEISNEWKTPSSMTICSAVTSL